MDAVEILSYLRLKTCFLTKTSPCLFRKRSSTLDGVLDFSKWLPGISGNDVWGPSVGFAQTITNQCLAFVILLVDRQCIYASYQVPGLPIRRQGDLIFSGNIGLLFLLLSNRNETGQKITLCDCDLFPVQRWHSGIIVSFLF